MNLSSIPRLVGAALLLASIAFGADPRSIMRLANLPKVALRVNGKNYGEISGSDLHVFLWKGVALAEGENRIEVRASGPGGTAQDSCVWTYRRGTADSQGARR